MRIYILSRRVASWKKEKLIALVMNFHRFEEKFRKRILRTYICSYLRVFFIFTNVDSTIQSYYTSTHSHVLDHTSVKLPVERRNATTELIRD